MLPEKTAILQQLKKDLLFMQGFRPLAKEQRVDIGLGPVEAAFPNAVFPRGAVHEFVSMAPEEMAAVSGFITAILSVLMQGGKLCVWISPSPMIFPPALKAFGVEPDRIIFIQLEKEKDMLWAMEETLKCEGLAAVIGEVREMSFTASRRLQLAVEQSRVTGFVLRQQPRNLQNLACVSRWRITPIPTVLEEGMPGVGFPRWKVELIKIRNGRPGAWELEWCNGRFRSVATKIRTLPITREIRKRS